MLTKENIISLLDRISTKIFGVEFNITLHEDQIYKVDGRGRYYLQVHYTTRCNKTGVEMEWSGGKWYLSDYMTEDEVVKKAWCAYQAAITHEMLETFLVDGKPLFNPHTPFEALLSVSDVEVKREQII